MINKIRNTISQYNMINTGDTVAVCLSGGADSMALFHFLCNNRDYYNITVVALHVNHGLREESRDEEIFVQQYRAKMDAECVVTRLEMNDNTKPQGLSTEMWAREQRYRFFFEKAKEYNATLATAHTSSDRAETVLFNITRGSSLKGATGIPPVRDNIIRPLIDCTREEIENYCRENHIPFVTDKTNFEDVYSRNKIRLKAIPVLKQINPAFEKSIGDFAKENFEIFTLLTQLSDNLYRRALGLGGLDVNILMAEHPRVIKNLLRNRLDTLGCLSKDNIRAVYAGLEKGSFKQQLSADIFCEIKNGRLSFYSPKKESDTVLPREVTVKFDSIIQFAHSALVFSVISYEEFEKIKENDKNYLTYCVNYDRIKGILKLRSRKTGDKFTFPQRNVTKTLKKLFVEEKVPRDFRDKIPVLTDETDNVIWLMDFGTNKGYLPQENSEKILLIKQM